MSTFESVVSVGHRAADWIITGIIAAVGFIVSRLSAPDWVTTLTVALLLVKIAHETFRFVQSYRRAALKRRLSDEIDP